MEYYTENFQQNWTFYDTFVSKLIFLIQESWEGLTFGLVLLLGLGLVLQLVRRLVFGFVLELTEELRTGLGSGLRLGVAWGLGFAFTVGLVGELTAEWILGLGFGLAFGLGHAVRAGLRFALIGGFAFALVGGVSGGFVGGGISGLAFIISYPRLYFLPFYFIKSYTATFNKNPYISDEIILFSLRPLEKKLEQQAHGQVRQALAFCQFLLEHRPIQKKFAYRLYHNVVVGNWYEKPFKVESFLAFQIIDKKSKYYPNEEWLVIWKKLQNQLADYQQQSNPRLKFNSFQAFRDLLQEFKNINLGASSKWNHYYFEVINKWLQEANERLKVLKKEAAGIVFNPYQTGDALEPERHKMVFKGREDLRDKLLFKLRNAEQMPLFLIQGQRRVGKTSLLKFLKELLGEGYKIVRLDLQGADDCRDVPTWMEAIRREFNFTLGLKEQEQWEANEDWLASWSELSQYLHTQTQAKQREFWIINY